LRAALGAGSLLFFILKRNQNIMELSQAELQEVLNTHNALWNALYDYDGLRHCVTYKDETYDIRIPPHRGYASAILPNKNGNPFLWITQNLNKSSYGSLAIERAQKNDQDHRITWIVDTTNGQFKYRTNISTTVNDLGQLIYANIEMYDSLGAQTIWSLNSNLITRKAEF